jgi:type VI protein secretion system component Hcp
MRRSRKFGEELAFRKRPSAPVDEAAEEHGLADEALRLQELVGNANTTQVLARSALQRDETATEAEPMSGDATGYTMTVADVGTFELVSWSWGSSDSGAGGGGAGPGKATFTELSATKKHDEHSAKLMQHSATGQHISTVELHTQKAGQRLVIKLKDVLVDSFQMGDADPPIETMTLSFAELEWDTGEKDKK